jgi:hypothetical protein
VSCVHCGTVHNGLNETQANYGCETQETLVGVVGMKHLLMGMKHMQHLLLNIQSVP